MDTGPILPHPPMRATLLPRKAVAIPIPRVTIPRPSSKPREKKFSTEARHEVIASIRLVAILGGGHAPQPVRCSSQQARAAPPRPTALDAIGGPNRALHAHSHEQPRRRHPP